MKLSEATYFPDAKELTRHGFVSHMEDFIGKLIGDNPLKADVDDYLKGFDIDAPKALELLTKPEIEGFPESAVVVKTERIKNGGYDENGKPMKDEFQVTYKVPKKDMANGIKGIDEKLRNLYIKLFENHIVEGTILNEEDGGGDGGAMEGMGGATNASSSGQYTTPLFGMVRRKGYSPKTTNEGKKKVKRPIGRLTMFITEEQMEQLAQLIKEDEFGGGALTTQNIGVDGSPNNWTYDVPFGAKSKNDPAMDHKNILSRKSKANQPTGHDGRSVKESKSGIHIDPENKGKFTATKKRTGKSTSELLHSPNKKTRARANFARMAKRGWKPLNESIYRYMEIDSSSLPRPLKKSDIIAKYKDEVEKVFDDYISEGNINTSTRYIHGVRLKSGAVVKFSARRKVDKGTLLRAGHDDWNLNYGGNNYWLLNIKVLRIKQVTANSISLEELFVGNSKDGGNTAFRFETKKEMLVYIDNLINEQNAKFDNK